MGAVMNDTEYLKSVKDIRTPESMLVEIVKKIDEGIFGHDPYYARFKNALMEQAKDVIKHPRYDSDGFSHEIQKCLVVWTGHITEGDNRVLESEIRNSVNYVVYGDEYNNTIWVDSEKEPSDYYHFSEAFRRIIEIAMSLGCHYIKFDSDGNKYDILPTFEW